MTKKKEWSNGRPNIKECDKKANMGLHWCNKCKKWRCVVFFHKKTGRKYGINSTCKICINKASGENDIYPGNIEKREMFRLGFGWCSIHKKFLRLSRFESNRKLIFGHYSYCKRCRRAKRIAKKQKEQQGFAD